MSTRPKITTKGFTRPQQAELRANLRALAGVIPSWCWDLSVTGAKEDIDDITRAKVIADDRYLYAQITIYPIYWELPADERFLYLTHELYHITESPLTNCVREYLDGLFPEDKRGPEYFNIINAIDRVEDMVVQELAHRWRMP